MKDMVPKGTGNSRFLRSSIAADITHEELVALLRSGKFPVDFAGLNSAGIQVQGSAYNKGNVLPDSVCSALGIPTTSEPKDAFLKVSSDRGLKIGDSILTENTMPSNFLPCDGRYIDRHTYSSLDSIMSAKHGFFRTRLREIKQTMLAAGSHKIVCNPDGYYAICTYVKEDDNAGYQSIHLGGRIYSSGADAPKVILSASQLGFSQYGRTYSDCTFTPDGDIVLVVHTAMTSSFKLFVYSNTGVQKVQKSISTTLQKAFLGLTTDITGTVWLIEYSPVTKDIKYYKIGSFSNPQPELVESQTTDNAVSGSVSAFFYQIVYYRVGKISSYYFVGNKRGTSLANLSAYTIGGVSSDNVVDIRQDNNGILYLYVLKDSTGVWYKTTNGTTFTEVSSSRSLTIFEYPNVMWAGYYTPDGIHTFQNFSAVHSDEGFTLNEHWYQKTPMSSENVYVSQNMGYYSPLFLHPSSKFLTDDGVIVLYCKTYDPNIPTLPISAPYVGLFKMDYQIRMPTYEVGGTYMQMKVKT